MSVTIRTVDPHTGELLVLSAEVHGGTFSLRRVPKHLLADTASPRVLEGRIAFAQAASSTWGQHNGPGTANEAVADLVPRATRSLREPTDREERQSYLRSLIPTDQLEEIEQLARQHPEAPLHVKVTRKASSAAKVPMFLQKPQGFPEWPPRRPEAPLEVKVTRKASSAAKVPVFLQKPQGFPEWPPRRAKKG